MTHSGTSRTVRTFKIYEELNNRTMKIQLPLSYNSTEKSRKVLLDISLPELKSDGSLVAWVLGCGFRWNEAEKCHKPLLTAGLLKTSSCAIPIFCSCSFREDTVPCMSLANQPMDTLKSWGK